MPENNDYIYVLTPSLAMMFLACLLFACWLLRRNQHFFLWLCAAYMLTALSLGIRSIFSINKTERYGIALNLLFLLGAWCFSQSFALRRNIKLDIRYALLISAITFAGAFYFSHIEKNLSARLHWFSIGVCLIQLLPVPAALKNKEPKDWLDKSLLWCYLAYAVMTGIRPLIVEKLSRSGLDSAMEVNSSYWVTTLLSILLFALVFTVLICAESIKQAFAELRRDRDHDTLTQILNRRAFYEVAQKRLADKRLYPMAILAGDIDYFKRINDSWGHDRGDQVLQLVSSTLQRNVRSQDLVARFGGEEFVILLTRIDLPGAENVAQRVREELKNNQQVLPEGTALTLSFGITSIKDENQLSGALKQADELLYSAKNAGRDRVHVEGVFYPDISFENTLPGVETSTPALQTISSN